MAGNAADIKETSDTSPSETVTENDGDKAGICAKSVSFVLED